MENLFRLEGTKYRILKTPLKAGLLILLGTSHNVSSKKLSESDICYTVKFINYIEQHTTCFRGCG